MRIAKHKWPSRGCGDKFRNKNPTREIQAISKSDWDLNKSCWMMNIDMREKQKKKKPKSNSMHWRWQHPHGLVST